MIDRAKEYVDIFGVSLPKWVACETCKKELSCNFIEGSGYYQPCSECRQKREYREKLDASDKESKRIKHVNDALQGQLPVAVHEVKGSYLYTNHRGDIIKEEKARPMKPGEKWKK